MTSDFKFYHDVIDLLKTWKLPFVSIDNGSNIPPDVNVILSSIRDDFTVENQFKGEYPIDALRSSLAKLLMKNRFSSLIIGIDPGPYPGIAVFADEVLMEAFECPIRENVPSEVSRIIKAYSYGSLVVKIGNGDVPNRDFLIRGLLRLNLNILMVDEKNTSFPHKIHDNALSAARIASAERKYLLDADHKNLNRRNMFEREFKTLRSQIESSTS